MVNLLTNTVRGLSIIVDIKASVKKHTLLGGGGGQWKKNVDSVYFRHFSPFFFFFIFMSQIIHLKNVDVYIFLSGVGGLRKFMVCTLI